jgi:hypothetical protein
MLAGALGAGMMSLFVWALTEMGISDVRMLAVIGTLVTRKQENASMVGGFIHLAAGMIFGVFYGYVLVSINHPGVGLNMLYGAVAGFLHGLIVAMILVAMVADEHPLKEFRQRGLSVAMAHWVAHLLYGLVVGAIIGASGLIGTAA